MNWLLKISRSQFDFLGEKVRAFRAVDLARAEGVLQQGFPDNQFFTTDSDRALFYASFHGSDVPGVIFECEIDSSRTGMDMNDASSEHSNSVFEDMKSAAYKIYKVLSQSDIEVDEREIEQYVGNAIGVEGYYDSPQANSLWLLVSQLGNVDIKTVRDILTPGYYSDLVYIDNRGVPGVAGDMGQQMQYSYFVPPQNIKAVFLHTSLLGKMPIERSPGGHPKNGWADVVSVIPAKIIDFAEIIEEQINNLYNSGGFPDSELGEELNDLLKTLQEAISHGEAIGEVTLSGDLYRKIENGRTLTEEDFSTPQEYFIRFELPANKMRVILFIRKALEQKRVPDRQMKFDFAGTKNHWMVKISGKTLYHYSPSTNSESHFTNFFTTSGK